MPKNLPYTIINVAMTADGKIDTFERQGAKISSDDDWQRVDRLRAACDAVMVGGRTLKDEDPRLTVKSNALRVERASRGIPENPTKVGVISSIDISPKSRFLTDGNSQVFIFTTERSSPEHIKALESIGVKVFVTGEIKVNLSQMMVSLSDHGIEKLLVEGGGSLNSALIQAKLVNEIQVYLAPMIFGGSNAPTLADGLGLSRENAIHLKTKSVNPLVDGGVIIQYQIS